MLANSPGMSFLPLLLQCNLHAVFLPSANTPGLSLHATHGPVLPVLAGAQDLQTDQDKVPRVCQAHQAQLLDLTAAVGSVMGPQCGPKPVDMRDLSTHE